MSAAVRFVRCKALTADSIAAMDAEIAARIAKEGRAAPTQARLDELAHFARFEIDATMVDSPRWVLVDADGLEYYADGTAVAREAEDPACLSFIHPAIQAWKAEPDLYRGLAYVDLTPAERARAAPDCDDVTLAVELWTRAFIASHTLPASEQAENYRIDAEEAEKKAATATEDGDMTAAERFMVEAREYDALAAEYAAQARLDAAKDAAQARLDAAEARKARAAQPESAFTMMDAGELLGTEFDPLVFLTKGKIELTAGAYILAGKPKHGKSWLAMGLAVSVCTGEDYLDTSPSEKGHAIYIACDDSSERRFQSRLLAVKPASSLTGRMGIVTQWSPTADSTIAVLDEVAGHYLKLRLVVIDTLSAFRKGQRTDSPYQQEYDELKALNDWAHTHDVVVVIVHHLRKGAVDPVDPFESISGTLGLQGAVDGMMVLSRTDDRDDSGISDRKLAGFWMRGRDIEGELNLGLELKDGRWRAVGTANDVFHAGTQRQIVQVLREAGGAWMTSKDIYAAGAFDCKLDGVKKAASRLAAKGEIESHRGALDGKSGGGGGFRIVSRGQA